MAPRDENDGTGLDPLTLAVRRLAALEELQQPSLTDEQIRSYWEGTLSDEERDEIEERLATSRSGAQRLLELQRIASAEGTLPNADLDAAWARFQDLRDDSGSNPEQAAAPFNPSVVQSQPPWSRLALAAAAFLLLSTLLLGFLVLQLQQQMNSALQPQANIAVIDLEPESSPLRDATDEFVVEIQPRGDRFVLVLPLRGTPRPFSSYRGELQRLDGTMVWTFELEPNSYESFTISLHRDFLPPGFYKFQISGIDGEREAPLEEYLMKLANPPD